MIHVVGAGVAGLAAAHALARSGRAVTLHEATPGAGGRARALPDLAGVPHKILFSTRCFKQRGALIEAA